MDSHRTDRWVQGASALGILFGLVLVTLELRQSATLVRAELGAAGTEYRQEMLTSVQGENLAAALARAMDNPANLSTEQELVLNAWYQNAMGQVFRQAYLFRLGVFEDPVEEFAALQARTYFGTAYAQAWWAEHRTSYPQSLRDMMDAEIEALPPDRDRERFDRIREAAAR